MTVAAPGNGEGILEKVTSENTREHGECEVTLESSVGTLNANLQTGVNLTNARSLQANENLSNRGFCLFGAGFIVETETASTLLDSSIATARKVIWNYRNGKDLTNRPREVMVIDAFPFTIDELQNEHPGVYRHLLLHVKPEHDNNAREGRRKLWWAFGEPNKKLRDQLNGLPRYIATVETSKHRFFTFLDQSILPDNKLIAIASDDPSILGVLSSSLHVEWALKSGSWLGVGNDTVYVKTRCFETFPFPALEEGELKQRIRDLGERLDAHRKRQQEQHPSLTLTGMYNVLEKLRTGETLTAKDKQIHDQALVTLLQQIHDDLDAAVLQAYCWEDSSPSSNFSVSAPQNFSIYLPRLVALNHARAADEKHGQIRYLRPDYQAPNTNIVAPKSPQQTEIAGMSNSFTETPSHRNPETPLPWPAKLPAQVAAIRQLLASSTTATPDQLSAHFGRKNKSRTEQIEGILETLKGLGQL